MEPTVACQPRRPATAVGEPDTTERRHQPSDHPHIDPLRVRHEEHMSNNTGPNHIVVDGSNIATEGRSMPSLQQLSEAVTAFMADYPDVPVTVVVDATFGHRINKSERAEFDEAVANNELVAPPAGAVGRGDAFVLNIARKSGATVLSNDSFQEFHGTHEWLFEEGRLIGGKPVPHVGWVFVARTPVRGTVSRQATRASRKTDAKPEKAEAPASKAASKSKSTQKARTSSAASEPMPTPKTPPPGAATVNELVPFLEFVERHPIGTSCTGVVDAYSSHGAYLKVDDVRVYVPLRLMADPPPPSARKVMKLGESATVVIAGFVPARRSIDAGLPGMVDGDGAPQDSDQKPSAKQAAPKKAVSKKASPKKAAPKKAVPKKSVAKKSAPKKTAATKAAPKKVSPTPAKATAAKATGAKSPAPKKVAAKKAVVKQSATKKAAPKKAATKKPATKKAPAKTA